MSTHHNITRVHLKIIKAVSELASTMTESPEKNRLPHRITIQGKRIRRFWRTRLSHLLTRAGRWLKELSIRICWSLYWIRSIRRTMKRRVDCIWVLITMSMRRTTLDLQSKTKIQIKWNPTVQFHGILKIQNQAIWAHMAETVWGNIHKVSLTKRKLRRNHLKRSREITWNSPLVCCIGRTWYRMKTIGSWGMLSMAKRNWMVIRVRSRLVHHARTWNSIHTKITATKNWKQSRFMQHHQLQKRRYHFNPKTAVS